ncbi:hypothetical protein KM043_010295 [Ampulex compressa]|nr:hypothetical protein KM043_010295 [Ampulex compressa]
MLVEADGSSSPLDPNESREPSGGATDAMEGGVEIKDSFRPTVKLVCSKGQALTIIHRSSETRISLVRRQKFPGRTSSRWIGVVRWMLDTHVLQRDVCGPN